LCAFAIVTFLCFTTVTAQNPDLSQFVTGIYGLVSSTEGKLPDWEKVRGCFLKEAVVVLRTSRTELKTFSVDGFIQDFVDFYERPMKLGQETVQPKVAGFKEKVLRMKTWQFGDIAHALVLYEASIPGVGKPQQGVDSWLLVRRDGRWLVAGITNEVVTANNPVPAELAEPK